MPRDANQTPAEVLKRITEDPAVMDEFVREYKRRHEERKRADTAFLASSEFKSIIDAIKAQPTLTFFDSETAGYFPDRMLKQLNLPHLSQDLLPRFFVVMGDSTSPAIEEGSREENADCPFPNCRYRLHGLQVSLLSGQGTIITVSNQ